MQETVKERLIAFIKSKPMTQKYFCEKIGVSNNFINSMRSGVSYEKLFRIKEEFPELNTGWLLYGEGNMLNETEATAIVPKNAIPFFDVDFEGGFDEMTNNQTAELDVTKDTISEALGHSYGANITGVYIQFKHEKIDAANRKVIDYALYGKSEIN